MASCFFGGPTIFASPLIKFRFKPGEMHVLKGFRQLEENPDVQDRFSFKSIPFIHYCIEESNFVV